MSLDKNRDGTISDEEIKAAPAALRKLDKDHESKRTAEEFRPEAPGGGGGPVVPGGGRVGDL